MRQIHCVLCCLIVIATWTTMALAQPPDGPRGPRPPWWDGRGPDQRTLEKPPLAADEDEERILAVLDDVDRNYRRMSVSPTDGRLLRQLAEAIGAKRVVELGTSTGYSGLWFALALRTTGGTSTRTRSIPRWPASPASTSTTPAWPTS